MAVVIDSGPVSPQDNLCDVPKSKWRELVDVRRSFCAVNIPYDCRELLRFVQDAPSMLKELGYKDLTDFVRHGLNLDPEMVEWAVKGLKTLKPDEPIPFEQAVRTAQVRAILAQPIGPHLIGKGKPGPGRGNKTDVINTRFTVGYTNAPYLTARIARDHPDIHERMKAGEFKSVRQAALEAGIVKPTFTCPAEPTAAARTIIRHFDAAQRRRLIELLQQSE